MSDITMKKEIRGVIRNSGFEANQKMLCSIVRIMNMKYSHIDNKKVVSLANEILNEQVV